MHTFILTGTNEHGTDTLCTVQAINATEAATKLGGTIIRMKNCMQMQIPATNWWHTAIKSGWSPFQPGPETIRKIAEGSLPMLSRWLNFTNPEEVRAEIGRKDLVPEYRILKLVRVPAIN